MAEQTLSEMRAQYHAYLLRLWREEGESKLEWHSQVDHIPTGHRETFHTLEKLLDFLRQQTLEPPFRKGGEKS